MPDFFLVIGFERCIRPTSGVRWKRHGRYRYKTAGITMYCMYGIEGRDEQDRVGISAN